MPPNRVPPPSRRDTHRALPTLAALAIVACGGQKPESKPPGAAEAPIAEVRGNPFAGVEIFWPPYGSADQARLRLEKSDPGAAKLVAKIAETPQARWLGEWSGEIETVAASYAKSASRAGKVPLFVAYNLPHRDCGHYSKGGAQAADGYRAWVDALARGIGPSRRAVVVLEPDALGHLDECLDEVRQQERLDLLRHAVEALEGLPGVTVYIDAGHSRWEPAEVMAQRLVAAGIGQARGFALNVANYVSTDELLPYGHAIVQQTGGTAHFVIDTSRNGNGPPDGSGETAWCNPPGRALGARPTIETGDERVDAFVWIKNPGESDGTCGGGPPAGQWFSERGLELAKNAKW